MGTLGTLALMLPLRDRLSFGEIMAALLLGIEGPPPFTVAFSGIVVGGMIVRLGLRRDPDPLRVLCMASFSGGTKTPARSVRLVLGSNMSELLDRRAGKAISIGTEEA